MTPTPDSLLKVAHLVASIARVPWKTMFPVYRALQREGLLPKSAGRRVEPATPRLIARLIVAFATSKGDDFDRDWFEAAGEGDTGLLLDHVERALMRSEDNSLALSITFSPEEEEAVIHYNMENDVFFYTPRHPSHPSNEDAPDAHSVIIHAPLFQQQSVVSGALLYRIAAEVTWGAAE